MKKILITGASGFIGQIIRHAYSKHYVEMWSRKHIDIGENEFYIQSQDLSNVQWWKNAPLQGRYDVIFHLAEPVKKNLGAKSVNGIVESHDAFLRLASKHATICVYPLTAYKYDLGLSRSNRIYSKIKCRVSQAFNGDTNIRLPIFHPLIGSGSGLNRLRQFEASIPYINFFSDFHSRMPVLYMSDLVEYIISPERLGMKMPDVYTKKISINELFHKDNRINVSILSKAVRLGLFLFANFQMVRLLLNGRAIND